MGRRSPRRPPPRPLSRTIAATAAAKHFGGLVDKVRETGAEYIVERGGSPVVRISRVEGEPCRVRDFVELCRAHARGDGAFGKAVEAGRAGGNRATVPRDPWES